MNSLCTSPWGYFSFPLPMEWWGYEPHEAASVFLSQWGDGDMNPMRVTQSSTPYGVMGTWAPWGCFSLPLPMGWWDMSPMRLAQSSTPYGVMRIWAPWGCFSLPLPMAWWGYEPHEAASVFHSLWGDGIWAPWGWCSLPLPMGWWDMSPMRLTQSSTSYGVIIMSSRTNGRPAGCHTAKFNSC